jgi:hypothetical protein
MRSAALLAVVAVAALWMWAAHFGEYAATFGALILSVLASRALWARHSRGLPL